VEAVVVTGLFHITVMATSKARKNVMIAAVREPSGYTKNQELMHCGREAHYVEESKKTKVVNRHFQEYDKYIGRGSKWGNPFSHQDGTKALYKVATREEAIEKYDKWLDTQPELLAALEELRGQRLGCYCAPRPCHGDVLVRRLEKNA
jgi:hypothetical protein